MTALQMAKSMMASDKMDIQKGKEPKYGTILAPEGWKPKTDAEIMAELDKDGMLLNGKGDSYKVIVPVDDEIKNIIADSIRDAFVNNNGYEQGEGHSVDRKEYIMTQPKDERLKVSYTLEQYHFSIVEKYKDIIKEHNPNWQWGDSYDPSIFDDFDPQALVLDTRA